MKFQKPSEKSVIETAASFGGVAAGAFLANGLMSVIHEATPGAAADVAKKENTMALVKRGGIIAVAVVAAASIKGDDTTSKFAKSVLHGMAGGQAIALVSDTASASPALAKDTKVAKFARAGLGLACPCNEGLGLNARRRGRGRKGLKEPFYYEDQPAITDYQPVALNKYELALQKGASLAA